MTKGGKTSAFEILNLHKGCPLRAASLQGFVRDLHRRLGLGKQQFNVCFVDDKAIQRLNSAFRGKDKATDVLSFPWRESMHPSPIEPQVPNPIRHSGITNFLGDVVISVPTAARHARAEGHSTIREVRWLILHGVLHLLGYDHETDNGEMVGKELALREELGISGSRGKIKSPAQGRKAKRKTEIVARLSP